MKSLRHVFYIALTAFAGFLPVHAQNTIFTYQGRVLDNGTNFTGAGQFKFALVTSTNAAGATATANMGGVSPNEFVSSCSVNNGGSGYTIPPLVTIAGGGGSGATATANLTGDAVTSITVVSPGGNYSSTPTVMIAPPATVYATYWSNDGTSSGGSEPGLAVTVNVASGLFTVVLGDTNLGNMEGIPAAVFGQPNLQLRIWFNDGANGSQALSPLQNLTPTPYATEAMNAIGAGNLLGSLPASQLTGAFPAQLSGTIPLTQLPGVVLTNNEANVN